MLRNALFELRPCLNGLDYKPKHPSSTVFVQSTDKIFARYGEQLLLFGERMYVNDNGDASFKSVAIHITNFPYYFYMDFGPQDTDTYVAIVKHINNETRNKISDWNVERLRRFVGFDYEAFVVNGKSGDLTRPLLKVYTKNPNSVKKIIAACQDIVDHRNRKIEPPKIYHDRHNWGCLFLYCTGTKLQEWTTFKNMLVTSKNSKITHCQEEYVFRYNPKHVKSFIGENTKPYLCAATRLRVASRVAAETKEPHAPSLDDQDKLMCISTDVYWNIPGRKYVRIRLWIGGGENQLDKDSDSILIQKGCSNTEHMMKVWINITNLFDVDILSMLNDVTNDMYQILFRLPRNNIGRISSNTATYDMNPKTHVENQFWIRHVGRAYMPIELYMMKLQIKPKFDAFTLKSAHDHPVMYSGEPTNIGQHKPLSCAFQTPFECVVECDVEAMVLRTIEQCANIIVDVGALSRVTTTQLTDIVGRGQQVRVTERFRSDCHKHKMFVNPEQVLECAVILPAKKFNTFPKPPQLPNRRVTKRDAKFDQELKQAILDNPVSPDMPFVHLDEPPDVSTFPPSPIYDYRDKIKYPAKVRKEMANKEKKLRKTRGVRDIFGNVVEPPKKKAKFVAKKYGGGFVHDPISGFYHRETQYVSVLDFASLYPSIIMARRFCYSTIVFDREALDDPNLKFMYVNFSDNDSMAYVTHVNGVEIKSLLPDTQFDMVTERTRIKKLMKGAGKQAAKLLVEVGLSESAKIKDVENADGVCETTKTRIVKLMVDYVNYDKQQLGSKVTQNAIYGYTGVEGEMAHMSFLPLMASITAVGRWMILCCAWFAIRYVQGAVVYGDTDSVFVQIPFAYVKLAPAPENETESEKRIRWNMAYWDTFAKLAEGMGRLFKSPNVMELECILLPLLLTDVKKTYIGKEWISPTVMKKLKVTGINYVKRDKCDWVRHVCVPIVDMIMNLKYDKILEFLRSQLDRLVDRKIPTQDLAVSCSLKHKAEYKNGGDNMIQLKIADKIEQRTGSRPEPYSRISYVVVEGPEKKVYSRGETVDYVDKHSIPIDRMHYLDQIRPVLEKVFLFHSHIVDMDKEYARCKQMISRNTSNSLFNFFGAKRPRQDCS